MGKAVALWILFSVFSDADWRHAWPSTWENQLKRGSLALSSASLLLRPCAARPWRTASQRRIRLATLWLMAHFGSTAASFRSSSRVLSQLLRAGPMFVLYDADATLAVGLRDRSSKGCLSVRAGGTPRETRLER